MRYFQKIYPSQPLVLSNGKGFLFPVLANGMGAHETENPKLLKEFDLAISRHIGGVTEITAAEFDALKKKAPLKNWNEGISPSRLAHLRVAADRAAADAAVANSTKQLTPLKRSLLKPTSEGRLNTTSYKPGTAQR